MAQPAATLMPFLYPTLSTSRPNSLWMLRALRASSWTSTPPCQQHVRPIHGSIRRCRPALSEDKLPLLPNVTRVRSLDPAPDDYSASLFADTAEVTIIAGSGGHGCVSFLREKFIAAGPANGGDGGTGGNVYISAVPALKSLHKLARRREIRAGDGRNGMGKSRGGQRGDDVVLEVPVGTIVREISRWDPVEEAEREWENEEIEAANARWEAQQEEKKRRHAERVAEWRAFQTEQETEQEADVDHEDKDGDELSSGRRSRRRSRVDEEIGDYEHQQRSGRKRRADMEGFGADSEAKLDATGDVIHERPSFDSDQRGRWRRDRWLLKPSSMPSEYATTDFPALPRPRRSNLAALQPTAPISLDLAQATSSPILVAAGAVGGLGNPHFATKSIVRPKFATRGNVGMRIKILLELKLLADLGFVGMPNAGKSTLLRALSNSRARVGSWAFTTLEPNLGTVVLDDSKGRAKYDARDSSGKRLNGLTVADIPGLIVGASQDRGLGLDFLRHVERAKVLAFVIDLSAGDAVSALQALWKELDAYERTRLQTRSEQGGRGMVNWGAFREPMQSTGGASSEQLSPGDDKDEQWSDVWTAPPPAASTRQQQQHQQAASVGPQSISEKPWFVVATKADVEGTQDNFKRLQDYLDDVSSGQAEHPAGQGCGGKQGRWKTAQLKIVPVSAIQGHGVEKVVSCTADLLAG